MKEVLKLIHSECFIKICLCIILIAAVWTGDDRWNSKPSSVYESVVVKQGDSVWTIASRFATERDDIRHIVVAIREINGLNNRADIYPGQIIKVPLTNLPINKSVNIARVHQALIYHSK